MANGCRVADWRFTDEQAMTVTGLIRRESLEGEVIKLQVVPVESHDSARIVDLEHPPRIEISHFCMLERAAGDSEILRQSKLLSRRSRTFAVLSAIGPAAQSSATKSEKRKKSRARKRLKKFLRKSAGAIGRSAGRMFPWRITLTSTAPKGKP